MKRKPRCFPHHLITALPFACAANFALLLPIAVPTLLRISRTDQGRIPESAGWRVLVGSLWTGILVLSAPGLRDPMRYSPGLLLQLIHKTLWRVVFALLLVRRREAHLIPWGIAISFIASVGIWPWLIPWAYLVGR